MTIASSGRWPIILFRWDVNQNRRGPEVKDLKGRYPFFSVVVPTRRRPAELERCLAAVSCQECSFPFDVIVVDNSSGDDATQNVARKWGARYVSEPRTGLCRARNRGALISSADIVAYLDDDSVPEPGWLAGFAVEFENPKVMAASGKTVPLRTETESEQLFNRMRGGAYDRSARLVVDKNEPRWFEICGFGGIGPGCNMAFRRKAFEVWPGFNERTDRGTPVHGGGEQYAFFTLVDRGYAVAYTPNAIVRHPFPPTMDVLKQRYLHDLTASTAYFTMLLVEEARHRRETLRCIWEAVRGTTREWPNIPLKRPRVVSRGRSALALGLGPFRYLQSLLASLD